MAALLTSKNNPLIKIMRLIAGQNRNAPRDLILAEGVRVIGEAMNAGCRVESLLLAEDFGGKPGDCELIDACAAARITPHRALMSLIQSISSVVASQGALALVKVPELALSSLPCQASPLVVCACGIQDPGNLGTLLRTAWAAGASLMLSTRDTVSARNPKSVRASAGAFFHLPVVEHLQPLLLREFCSSREIRLYRTSPHEGMTYHDCDFRGPTAILLGSESQGIPALQWTDVPALRIPMAGTVESLNVASAGAILLFEALRQRLAESGDSRDI